jgi:hypothetical protein
MKTLSCKKTKRLISEYSQDLLTPLETEGVREHLADCPDCQKDVQQTERVLRLLGKDRLPDPGEAFWKGITNQVMSEVRQVRTEPRRIPWFSKIWGHPFGWPGYAWATAVLLILLTPVVIYTIHSNKPLQTPNLEWSLSDWTGERGGESLATILETLSLKESSRLEKKVVAQLGKDLPNQTFLRTDDEPFGDLSLSLDRLNKEELELLIDKLQTGRSVGFKEEGRYAA